MSEEIARKLIEGSGGKIDESSVMHLPDGSGCFTASFPLPKDHWLYAEPKNGYDAPPMGLRMGAGPQRDEMARKIREAVKYAYRGCTMRGKEDDIDPDALLQNVVVGLLGYWTEDALSTDKWANPDPVPPLMEVQERGASEVP